MTNRTSLLSRTRAAMRIIRRLDKSQQEQLRAVTAELALIERILNQAFVKPAPIFMSATLEVLDNTLELALDTIQGAISEEGRS